MNDEVEAAIAALTLKPSLYGRAEVLARPSPVPARPGLSAWYFRGSIPGVSTNGCIAFEGGSLLYLGMSPRGTSSSQNLRKRLTYHYRGNAEGSTLRLTLGVLLGTDADIALRRVGSGKRMTFTHLGEQWLDAWMATNALVTWYEHPAPWRIEAALLARLWCPLNVADNAHHPFVGELQARRHAAKLVARSLPIAQEGNQRRRPPDIG